jgi:hypothetical protein
MGNQYDDEDLQKLVRSGVLKRAKSQSWSSCGKKLENYSAMPSKMASADNDEFYGTEEVKRGRDGRRGRITGLLVSRYRAGGWADFLDSER